MSLTDALIVTALGMGVVFVGLILTSLLITAFGLLSRFDERKPEESHVAEPKVTATAAGPVDGAVMAVISTVLEVERRLHHAETTGRLTIVRSNEPRRSQ